jgi:putative two-component system response regulator
MRSPAVRRFRTLPIAAALSFGVLAIPVAGAIALPESWRDAAGFLWLVALVPAVHMGRLHGWRGSALALAGTMAFLVLVHLAASPLARPVGAGLSVAIPLLLVFGAGLGWLLDPARSGAQPPGPDGPDLGRAFQAAREGRSLSAVLFEIDPSGPASDGPPGDAPGAALDSLRDIVGPAAAPRGVPGIPRRAVLALLEGSGEESGAGFAERVRDAFAAARPSAPPVRAGVASLHPAMASPGDLVAAAMLALRRAREGGPGSIRIFGRPAASGVERAEPAPSHRDAPGEPGNESARPGEPPAGDDEPSRRPSLEGRGRRILLVDDETPLRAMVSAHLRRKGFSVAEGTDAGEGIRALGEEFEAVITDLPSGEGDANLITAVKARWPATPVVAITGFGDARVAAEALQAGADRYLFKPFGTAELEQHLAELLARRDRTVDARTKRHRAEGERPAGAPLAREAIIEGARALVKAVEVRDPFTRGHADRVARYSEVLLDALEAGGTSTGIERACLRLACELHDVGKLGVTEEVLNKEGRLTPEEYREVREHPRASRRILSPLLDDELVLAVAAWHHERWDGEGYPDGLAGEAIPLPARIVAMADALDAMTSPRAYRARLSWNDAVGQIRARAGSQFDPGLLPAFEGALAALAAIHARAVSPDGEGPSTGVPPEVSSSESSPEPQETG